MWNNKMINPILFQGNLNKHNYFEGWYFKQVSEDKKAAISFIPGISLFNSDEHSFIQYIYSKSDDKGQKITKVGYERYKLTDFSFSNKPFQVRIKDNIFTESKIVVDICNCNLDNDNLDNVLESDSKIQGRFELGKFLPIQRSITMPNIMGFFAYIPKMECYHGIVSMGHNACGSLVMGKEKIDFGKGNGYIEKDWGTSFPKKYIWIQCNNFSDKSVGIFCSIADIPFLGSSFLGFICNLVIEGKEYRFATYNNCKLKVESITDEKMILNFENNEAILTIEAFINDTGELIAPKLGKMKQIVKEELSGKVKISLFDKNSKDIFEDIGDMAGIEKVGY